MSVAGGHASLRQADAPPARAAGHRSAADKKFIIESADTPRAFGELWPDLSNLAARADVRAYPFQCRDHLEIWLETIGMANRVRPFFARVNDTNGRPLLLLPLGIRRQASARILEFLDCGVADYNAPVLFSPAAQLSPEAARALWIAVRHAAPRFDVAMLRKMPEFVGDLRNPLYTLASEKCAQSGHHILLGRAPAEMLQSKHDSKETKRRRARLSDVGEIRFQVAASQSEIDAVFAEFIRQKSAQYRERTGSDGFDVPGQRDYYRSLARRLVDRGVELVCLRVGGAIVATAWCLIAGRRYYYMMCAHEGGRWGKFGTGRLLLEDLIERASRDGLEAFDLGFGDEDYKLRWNQTTLALADALEPVTLLGRLFCAAAGAREAMRDRLPAPVRRLARALAQRT